MCKYCHDFTTSSNTQTTDLFSEFRSDLSYITRLYDGKSRREFEQAEAEWKKAITYSHCNPEIHLAYADMAHRYNRIDIATQTMGKIHYLYRVERSKSSSTNSAK